MSIDKALVGKMLETKNETLIEAITRDMAELEAPAGQVLVTQGDVDTRLYFQVEGICLGVYHMADSGISREIVECIVQPGDIYFMGTSLDEDGGAICDLVAGTNVRIYAVPKSVGVRLVARYPHLMRLYLRIALESANKHRRFQLSLAGNDVATRFRWLHKEYPTACALLPQNVLARAIGTTPEHLSRMKRRMEDDEKAPE